MALTATQRKLIADLLDLGNGHDQDEFADYLFQSRKAFAGADIPPDEKGMMTDFLKSLDTAMKRLSIFHLAALESRNEEETQETLKDLTGMWEDICTLLRSPTIPTLTSLNSFVNSNTILAKVNRLNFLKPHLHHELSSDDESSNRNKRAKTENSPFTTSNKFAALSTEEPSTSSQPTPAEVEKETDMDHVTESENPEPTKKPRVEPIFIALCANYGALIQHLNKEVLKEKVVGKLVGEHIKIIPGSPDDYRALTAYLRSNNLNFHAILPRAEKPMKVIIKGLGAETPPEEIAKELTELGFGIKYISALRNRAKGTKLPLFHVTLQQTPGWEKIYDVNILQCMYVTIQRFYSTAPKQCYRCQGFGHSSQTCYMPERCLKCAQAHATKTCTKPRDVKAKCVNCAGEHTANYQGCPANPRNKKPQLPFKQRFLQNIKAEKERKKRDRQNQNNIQAYVMPDAPLPKVPAWTGRNERIFLPPGASTAAAEVQQQPDQASEPSQPMGGAASQHPPTPADQRALAAARSQERVRETNTRHAEIVATPNITPLPAATSSPSGFADMIGALKEFQQLMETIKIQELISLLKQMASQIKAAPTEMDKLAVLLDAANKLSQIFSNSS